MIGLLFRFQGRNSSNFCSVFLENWRHQKVNVRLTDLYMIESFSQYYVVYVMHSWVKMMVLELDLEVYEVRVMDFPFFRVCLTPSLRMQWFSCKDFSSVKSVLIFDWLSKRQQYLLYLPSRSISSEKEKFVLFTFGIKKSLARKLGLSWFRSVPNL